MEKMPVDPPTQAEMRKARAALRQLADELDKLAREAVDMRPHALVASLLALSLTNSVEHLIEAIEFCDMVANTMTGLDGDLDVPETRMVRHAQREAVDVFSTLVEGMCHRADQAAPTVNERRPSSPPAPADTDPRRAASRALLAAYDASQAADPDDEGLAIRDIDQLFERLRKALGQ
jgi:hypothetical protein